RTSVRWRGRGRRVVAGDVLEGLSREAAPVISRGILLAQALYGLFVIRRLDEDENVREVFGGGAQHGWTADIDVLERGFEWHFGFRDSLAKGVKVYGDEVDRREALTGQLIEVLGLVAAGEQPRVNSGMERLDAPVEDLGEAGEVGDGAGGYAGLGEVLKGTAGRDDLEAESDKPAGKIGGAGLIVGGDEGDHRQVVLSSCWPSSAISSPYSPTYSSATSAVTSPTPSQRGQLTIPGVPSSRPWYSMSLPFSIHMYVLAASYVTPSTGRLSPSSSSHISSLLSRSCSLT